MAVDILHNELKIGDYVAFLQPNYRNLLIGKVIKFTAKTVDIEFSSKKNKNIKLRTNQRSCKVIKIDTKEAFIHMI